MARQNNAEYWAQRMKNMEEALLDQSYSYVENLEAQFAKAQAEIERQLAAWYQRFAANNDITLADAKRLLNSMELEEFHWTVEEYIKYGKQNALDGQWMKQLENASARVHISRLDAIKLQIQQQAEVLYQNQLDAIDAAARQIYEGSYYHTAFEVQRGLGVGWSMQALNERTISKVLSRPWTADNQTFRDRCWTNKQNLVNSVNTQLTQMIIRGEAPDRAINAIAKQFEVSKAKAGRLVMTESAYFASAAQHDCYGELGVERYQIVAAFDHDTCSLCASLNGEVFKMSDYEVGLTAPPFHPWCRCCTCPWFEDMVDLGERWVRNADGSTGTVPANTSFEDWKKGNVKATLSKAPDLDTGVKKTADSKKATGKTPAAKSGLADVTAEYAQSATPGQGAVTYGEDYKKGKHKEEVDVANWLHDTYGGDIELLTEASAVGVKMPDYKWRGKLWELKTATTAKSADGAVRQALKQIQENPGGVVLDYGDNDFDADALLDVLTRRIIRGKIPALDVIIKHKGKTWKVFRHKKA